MTVIKRDDIANESVQDADLDSEALVEGLRSRISRDRVQMKENASRPSARSRRVLHAGAVNEHVESYAIPVAELDPDFPLPEPPSSAPPEDAEGDEADADDPDDPPPTPEEIEAQWKARLEEAVETARTEGYEKGYSEGYDDGFDEAESQLKAEFEAHRDRVVDDMERVRTAWRDYIEESEPHLAQTTIDVAETLMDAPLPDSVRRVSARAIAEAVEDLADTPPLTISLHPVDYQHLQETGMLEQLNANHDYLRWNTRPELDEGDWSVESPVAMVRHFRDELIRNLRTRLGALRDGDASDATPPPTA
jgi:flagellar assembly protein FliH